MKRFRKFFTCCIVVKRIPKRIFLVAAVIALAVLVGIGVLVSVSSSTGLVSVIDAPIWDEAARDRIIMRINQEGVQTTVSPAGVIQVENEATARRMRGILIREDLIPAGTDPWEIFDRERWEISDWNRRNITEFERNVNYQRAITQIVTNHILALDDVDNAHVVIVRPERDSLNLDNNQNQISASVIIFPRPGSDITQNREKIEGIEKLLQYSIEGLEAEYIVICDNTGIIPNDFRE